MLTNPLTSRRSRKRVRQGHGVKLGRRVRFHIAAGATLTLGDGVVVGAGTRFDVEGADVVVGTGTVLGRRCVVAARERVTVGERCRLGDEVVLMDFDHAADDHERPVREQGLVTAPVAVGDDAVLDDAVVVLHGATIGAGAHVTTRAVVTRDVAPGAVVGGVPARGA